MHPPYAELHSHTNFSFLHGASPVEDMAERAAALGLSGLAVTDHDGLYGVVRFATAAQASGVRPIIGIEIELLDAAAPDPSEVVVPARRRPRGRRPDAATLFATGFGGAVADGVPARPRPERARLPGHRAWVKEDLRGIGGRQRGPHLVLLARDASGYRSLCRLVSRANLDGTKRVPRFTQGLLAGHLEGLLALSGGRDGEIARRLLVGDRAGARLVAERYATLFGRGTSGSGDPRSRGGAGAATSGGDSPGSSGFFIELTHHLLPDDDWLVAEHVALADELGLPVVVTNDVHYARPEDRELHDVLTGIFHGRTLDTLADLRRPDGESYLKSAAELAALPPGDSGASAGTPLDGRVARAWSEGIATAGEIAASCTVDLGFEQYRFPGFPVPKAETPFSYLSSLCWEGARKRYHPLTAEVVKRLAHELGVIERAGLAEFFLICWDLMRFAKEEGIPAQGRGSATSSIVSYTLGISRVEPIAHNLLFERFINEGRTTYPDVDIDFSSERREEVIQYIYRRYGPEHTGMVCNLVTYRARSAVREVGYALGFPRPLVDRVAKALETYDSVMVRRDLEADGGFAEFFRRPGEVDPATGAGDAARAVVADAVRGAAAQAEAHGLVDGMGQLNRRMPLVGKVPPWRQPPKPVDPSAPPPDRPFAWLHEEHLASERLAVEAADQGQEAADPCQTHTPGSFEQLPPAGSSPGTGVGAEILPARTWAGMESASTSAQDTDHPLGARPHDPTAFAWQELARDTDVRAVAAPAGEPGPAPGMSQTFTGGTRDKERVESGAVDVGGSAGAVPAQAWNGTNVAASGTSDAARAPGSMSNVPPAHVWDKQHGAARAEGMPGPSRSGMWEEAPASPPAIRPGGRADDEGGPGDTPASVAWLRAGRGTGYATDRDKLVAPALVQGRRIDPESGMPETLPRRTDAVTDRLGRPNHWAGAGARPTSTVGAGTPGAAAAALAAGATDGNIRGGIGVDRIGRADPHSSVARVEPEAPSQPRGGSTVGMSDWERWLEFCARIDGFPRHLSIHSGGMLVTAAPLIDIAPLERATMVDRVVVQFDKRDVEELKLIKLDLLGLGMLAAIDETVQLIEHDCGTCVVLDAIPEQVPEVFEMVQAADTVGVFQIESRAQMQTLPKSKPKTLDDLVVEVAIIRPGPIQGNAVHPYLRRKQGLEPVEYLHPSLEPVLRDSMGVILYQEQVMRIAIEVAGFSPAESDGFRRAMGTWRSNREMEKLHQRFHDGCLRQPGMTDEIAEELFRQVSAFASFGFAKSHAAAFARTAYESSFLKLFYPAQFLVGLINAQPMGFYPVEVLVNDAKRHGVAVLPVDLNASTYKTGTEWVGQPGWAIGDGEGEGEPLPEGVGIEARPVPVRSPACVVPGRIAREQWAAESATGWGVRLGLHLVKGIGEQHEELLDDELARGPYVSLADVVERTGLPEETIERLIRTGALDSLGRPRRELLWQLREVTGASRGSVGTAGGRRSIPGRAAGRPLDLRLPATAAPELPPISEPERLGDAYAVVGLDAKRQVISLFRDSLDRLGAITNSALSERREGKVRIGGLVVTRQHPMTAKGTVFLALEDETGMVNVTLWPDTWARLRGVVRRHALLLVDGDLQRESAVVNVIAREVRPLTEVAERAGGPESPQGVRQLGHAGMRRLG